jgi:ribosomal protein S18 acetylase RimI-like enzyme
MNDNEIILKVLKPKDSVRIAYVHYKSFPNFFLTSLGEKFLSLFYFTILKSEYGYGVGLYLKNDLCAFAIGSSKTNGFYKMLAKKNMLVYMWSILPVIVKKPKALLHILFSLLNESNLDTSELGENTGVLLSICTLPEAKGTGLGKKTLTEFEKISVQNGVKTILLTTDNENNDGVNSFYKSNGYVLSGTYSTKERRKMNRYIKNIKCE